MLCYGSVHHFVVANVLLSFGCFAFVAESSAPADRGRQPDSGIWRPPELAALLSSVRSFLGGYCIRSLTSSTSCSLLVLLYLSCLLIAFALACKRPASRPHGYEDASWLKVGAQRGVWVCCECRLAMHICVLLRGRRPL